MSVLALHAFALLSVLLHVTCLVFLRLVKFAAGIGGHLTVLGALSLIDIDHTSVVFVKALLWSLLLIAAELRLLADSCLLIIGLVSC